MTWWYLEHNQIHQRFSPYVNIIYMFTWYITHSIPYATQSVLIIQTFHNFQTNGFPYQSCPRYHLFPMAAPPQCPGKMTNDEIYWPVQFTQQRQIKVVLTNIQLGKRLFSKHKPQNRNDYKRFIIMCPDDQWILKSGSLKNATVHDEIFQKELI